VLQAAALGKGGETFVLDMGKPVRIMDLATDLIRLSGLEVGHDIRIEFTGLRPGEKMFEELFLDSEHHDRTAHEKIWVARNGNEAGPSERWVVQLVQAARQGDVQAMRQFIAEHVPTLAAPVAPPPIPQEFREVVGRTSGREQRRSGG